MEHRARETDGVGDTPSLRRQPAALLGGLPRPLRAAVVVTIAATVGLGGLCRAGVVAPQLSDSGGGSGGGAFPGGAAHVGWTILRNNSWRSWTVTDLDGPSPDRDLVAFLKPPATSTSLPDQLIATAATPALTRLPLTVPRGGELVVLEFQKPNACTQTAPPPGIPFETRASIRIATPLGPRRVSTTVFRGALSASSVARCQATP